MEKGKILGAYRREDAKDQDIEDLFFQITGGVEAEKSSEEKTQQTGGEEA